MQRPSLQLTGYDLKFEGQHPAAAPQPLRPAAGAWAAWRCRDKQGGPKAAP